MTAVRSCVLVGLFSLVIGACTSPTNPAASVQVRETSVAPTQASSATSPRVVASASGKASEVSNKECAAFKDGRSGRTPGFSKVEDEPKVFLEFLGALQRAVESEDMETLQGLIDFELIGVGVEDFRRRFKTLINPCIRKALSCTELDDVAEDSEGIWIADDALLVDMPEKGQFKLVSLTGQGYCRGRQKP